MKDDEIKDKEEMMANWLELMQMQHCIHNSKQISDLFVDSLEFIDVLKAPE